MKRVFYVCGLRPAHSKQANDLLKAFDLGIEGAFEQFAELLTCTLSSDVTQDKLNRQPIVIKEAYEKLGCTMITVIESEVMPTA